MAIQYDNLRPEKADNFDLDQFKSDLEKLPNFKAQIELFDTYFDVLRMGRRIVIDANGKPVFHFYREPPIDSPQGYTPEKQTIFTKWREARFMPLLKDFTKLASYEDRIKFCKTHFDTEFSTYEPEKGIVFSTYPQTPTEWEYYNKSMYEYYEREWFLNEESRLSDKSFSSRVKAFDTRLRDVIPQLKNKIVQDEINELCKEYEQPGKSWNESSAHFNILIDTFRNRLKGNVLQLPSRQTDLFQQPNYLLQLIEAEHAFQYCKYLYGYLEGGEKTKSKEIVRSWPMTNQENINFIKGQMQVKPMISNAGKIKTLDSTPDVTQAQLALFYYYCHETKCLPPFVAGQMEQSYINATKPYGLAWKPFQQLYNRFGKSNKDRFAPENRKSLKAVIQLLQDHPEALALAKDELRTAETRNPIT